MYTLSFDKRAFHFRIIPPGACLSITSFPNLILITDYKALEMHRRRNGAIGVLLVALIVSQNLIQISAFQLSADPPKGEKTGDQGEDKAACGCVRRQWRRGRAKKEKK